MAQVVKNSFLNALRGGLGKELVFKQYTDKVVVSKYPDMSKVQPSELQKLNRSRMKEANEYARTILRDPELRAAFEKKLKAGESVFHKAKKEYFDKLKEQ